MNIIIESYIQLFNPTLILTIRKTKALSFSLKKTLLIFIFEILFYTKES
jgi:hypothetical protein